MTLDAQTALKQIELLITSEEANEDMGVTLTRVLQLIDETKEDGPDQTRHTADRRQFVNIEPTPAGYRQMKQMFQQQVVSCQQDVHMLEQMEDMDMGNWFDDDDEREHAEMLMTVMIDEKIVKSEASMKELQESVAELERCGY